MNVIDFPEVFYYLSPVVGHVLVTVLVSGLGSKIRRGVFFLSTLIAILGIIGISALVDLGDDQVERFSESMLAVTILCIFNLYSVHAGSARK